MVEYRPLISAAGLGGEQPSTDGAVDLALLKAHCSGDPDAFTELVRRHRDRLWRAALVLLRDREDAADAVQDALIRAFRSASTFRAEAQVATWLHSIVIRVCMDRIATRRRRATCPLTEERAPRVEDTGDAFLDELVITEVVRDLPDDQRESFVRVDLLGFSFADTAAELGIPEGTVKSRRARAKVRVVEALRQAQLVGPNRVSAQSHPQRDQLAGPAGTETSDDQRRGRAPGRPPRDRPP